MRKHNQQYNAMYLNNFPVIGIGCFCFFHFGDKSLYFASQCLLWKFLPDIFISIYKIHLYISIKILIYTE